MIFIMGQYGSLLNVIMLHNFQGQMHQITLESLKSDFFHFIIARDKYRLMSLGLYYKGQK